MRRVQFYFGGFGTCRIQNYLPEVVTLTVVLQHFSCGWFLVKKVAKFDYMSCPAPAMRLLMLGMKVLLFTLATSHQFLGMDTLVQPLEISTLHMSSLVQKTAASCGMLWVGSAARTHKHPNIQKTHGHS